MRNSFVMIENYVGTIEVIKDEWETQKEGFAATGVVRLNLDVSFLAVNAIFRGRLFQ